MELREGEVVRIGDKNYELYAKRQYYSLIRKTTKEFDIDITNKMFYNNNYFDFFVYDKDGDITMISNFTFLKDNMLNTDFSSLFLKEYEGDVGEVLEAFMERYPDYVPCMYCFPPK